MCSDCYRPNPHYTVRAFNEKPYIAESVAVPVYCTKAMTYTTHAAQTLPLYSASYSSNPTYVIKENYTPFSQVSTAIEHEPLLREDRPSAPVVENSTTIKRLAERIFEMTTGTSLPEDIIISIIREDELNRLHSFHGGRNTRGVQGFAVNRSRDIKSVFVKQGSLDMLLLTLGHEIGHVISPTASTAVMEEAKAFAFELAWMKTIYENNVAGLAGCMNIDALNPAQNGLHNVAFDIVLDKVKEKDPLEVFVSIANNLI